MNSYIEDRLRNCKYNKGDVLIFTGGSGLEFEMEHSKHFKKGQKYQISETSIIDYEIDELDTNYGKIVIYFVNYDYACFTEFADKFFMKIDELRDNKINSIIND